MPTRQKTAILLILLTGFVFIGCLGEEEKEAKGNKQISITTEGDTNTTEQHTTITQEEKESKRRARDYYKDTDPPTILGNEKSY